MIDETGNGKSGKDPKSEPYPKQSVYCRQHGRWTDSFGDCLECLSGPTLGSQEWDEILIRQAEARERRKS